MEKDAKYNASRLKLSIVKTNKIENVVKIVASKISINEKKEVSSRVVAKDSATKMMYLYVFIFL